MIVSRLLPLFRTGISFSSKKRLFSTSKTSFGGHGEWAYRVEATASRTQNIAAEVGMAFMWWWVFWHIFTDSEHLLGEFDWQDPLKWTDEELGIPPDDEEDLESLVALMKNKK